MIGKLEAEAIGIIRTSKSLMTFGMDRQKV